MYLKQRYYTHRSDFDLFFLPNAISIIALVCLIVEGQVSDLFNGVCPEKGPTLCFNNAFSIIPSIILCTITINKIYF